MINTPALIPELKVTDFKTSLNFYTKVAGFEILYDRPEDDFAMLSINGSSLMIEALADKNRNWSVGELKAPFGRGVNFQIRVQDVEGLYEKFKKTDWPIFLGMEEKWYRLKNQEVGNKQFLIQDPDGYLLRFFQDLGTR